MRHCHIPGVYIYSTPVFHLQERGKIPTLHACYHSYIYLHKQVLLQFRLNHILRVKILCLVWFAFTPQV